MKSVKFINPWSKYSPGDIAGFEPEQSQRLIDAKAAEAYEPEPEPEVKSEAKTKAPK